MVEEIVRALAAAAPGSLAGIVMLIICFRHLAGEREARAQQQHECHEHNAAMADKLQKTIDRNTTAVTRCAEMHGAVTQALQTQAKAASID